MPARALSALLIATYASASLAQPAPQPLPAPSATTTPSITTPGADWVDITLLSDDPRAALFRKEAAKRAVGDEVGNAWVWVCDAPCNAKVDPRLTFRVMGEGLEPSTEFNLAPGSGHVTLQVHTASRSGHTAGIGFAVVGATAALAGGFIILLAVGQRGAADALSSASTDAASKLQDRADTYQTIGLVLLGAGAALGVGALLLLLPRQTSLEPSAAPEQKQSAGPHLVPGGFTF